MSKKYETEPDYTCNLLDKAIVDFKDIIEDVRESNKGLRYYASNLASKLSDAENKISFLENEIYDLENEISRLSLERGER